MCTRACVRTCPWVVLAVALLAAGASESIIITLLAAVIGACTWTAKVLLASGLVAVVKVIIVPVMMTALSAYTGAACTSGTTVVLVISLIISLVVALIVLPVASTGGSAAVLVLPDGVTTIWVWVRHVALVLTKSELDTMNVKSNVGMLTLFLLPRRPIKMFFQGII